MAQLICFASNQNYVRISADLLQRDTERCLIAFSIEGELEKVLWPDTFKSRRERLDNLWQHTCFEAFFSHDLSPDTPYYEINCSPNGDWNFYQLLKYRHDLQSFPAGKVELLDKENTEEGVRFIVAITGLPADIKHIGLTAVIESTQGELSYWALAHPGKTADFHDKRAFLL